MLKKTLALLLPLQISTLELKRKCKRFWYLKFSNEHSTEQELPVHTISVPTDYQRVETMGPLMLSPNRDKNPGAEFTMLGWAMTGNDQELF